MPSKKTLNAIKPAWLVPVLLGLLVLGLLLWANFRFSAVANAGTDFLERWLPAQLMIYAGERNPYADEVSYQVQLARYGRPAQGHETPCLFAYPYYILIFILPLALIKDFVVARALWMTLLQAAHVAILLLSLRMVGFQPRRWTLILLMGFALISFDMLVPVVEGNPSSLAALFMVLCLFFLQKKKDVAAGVFLALATIKPQMMVLFFGLVWLWAFSHRRSQVLWASGISVAVLMGVSFLLLPEWFSEFLRQMFVYPAFAQPNTPATIFAGFLPPQAAFWIGRVCSLGSLLLLGWAWFRTWKQDFRVLMWTAGLTFAVLPFSGIASTRTNLVALLPAVVLLVQVLSKRLQHKAWAVNALLLTVIMLSWVIMVVTRMELPGGVVLAYLDLLPLPLLMIIGLLCLRREAVEG